MVPLEYAVENKTFSAYDLSSKVDEHKNCTIDTDHCSNHLEIKENHSKLQSDRYHICTHIIYTMRAVLKHNHMWEWMGNKKF